MISDAIRKEQNMKREEIQIRAATANDAEELLGIYEPYVRETAVTFEYDVPTLEEFKNRISHTLKRYPVLVAEENERILGYAYTGPFIGRAAYSWSAETSIYFRKDKRRQGIGRILYDTLEQVSKAQHILNFYACISCPETEDEYLTADSIQFHTHLGYRTIGRFYKCGYKFGRWYNMVWMEKILGEHETTVRPVIPFPDLKAVVL